MTEQQEASNPATAPERLKELAQQPNLAALVAANQAAPGWLLSELIKTRDRAITWAVAANPNTPPELLAQLARHHPDALLINPLLPLLTLSQPNFLTKIGDAGVRALITNEACPHELLQLVAQNKAFDEVKVRAEARLHITMRGELGPEWKRIMIDELWVLPYWRQLQRRLIPCPTTPPLLQERLASHPDRYFRLRFAANHTIDAAIQLRLAADQEPVVRRALARNQALTPETIAILAEDADPETRRIIARPNRAPRWRERQLMDWDVLIGGRLIYIAPILAAFSSGALWQCMLSATAMLYPPPDPVVLETTNTLAHSVRGRIYPDSDHRYVVTLRWVERLLLAAHHPATNGEQLRMLADDPNIIVRAAARERLAAQDHR